MKVLSLGLGTQSTAMYLMSSLGYIDRADVAIFADPCAELPDTYKLLDYLLDWKEFNDGIPIHVVKQDLYKDLMNGVNSKGAKFIDIPAFTNNGDIGQVRRQCTFHYKIEPVVKKIRELQGLKPRQRMKMTEVWLGITMDELQRMKKSLFPRIKYVYPFYEKKMTRADCIKILEDKSFHNVPKSSCVFCPFKSDKNWKDLKFNDPESFKIAVDVDKAIRNGTKQGEKGQLFLHRSCLPLDKVEFADQQELFMCEGGFCGM